MWLFNWFFNSNMFPQRSRLLHLINWLSDPFVFLCVRFGLMLFNHCAGMVKQRTCFTNYAPLWANMKFLHDNFRSFFCEKWRFLLSQLQTSNLFILQDCLRRSWLSLEQIPRFPGSGAGCSDAKPPHRNRCPNPYPSKITYFCQTTLFLWSRGT